MKGPKTMPFEVLTIPCLSDNYAYIIANTDTAQAAIVDVPDAGPLNAALAEKGWTLTAVLLTHHHWDHVDGLADLDGAATAEIIGAAADAHRLPKLTRAVAEGDHFQVLGCDVSVFDVSGHTVGHIAFYMPQLAHVFTADSLMALGCGRLFEGTPAQMWDSLQKLRALPDETTLCSGHEYTQTNAAFAITIDPGNTALTSRKAEIDQRRSENKPTVPTLLGLEKQTNPFLRADDPAIRANLGLQAADDAAVFAEIRKRKDNY